MYRLVGVAYRNILADERDAASLLGLGRLPDESVPDGVLHRPDVEVELPQDLLVQPLLAQLPRHCIYRVCDVLLLDDALALHVAEHRELLHVLLRYRHLRAADENVGDDADVAEHSDGMLRRLCLELSRRLEVWNERKMHEAGVLRPLLEAELPRRLKKRQRLYVARDSSDFAENNVGQIPLAKAAARARKANRRFYLVSYVRHYLHRSAEVAARTLAREDCGVDAARGEIARLCARNVRKALVVAEVEVGLRAVVRHEDFAVLIWRHRPWIDIEIRVELLHEDLVSAALEEQRQRRGGYSLSKGAHYPAGDEDVFDLLFHGCCLCRRERKERKGFAYYAFFAASIIDLNWLKR